MKNISQENSLLAPELRSDNEQSENMLAAPYTSFLLDYEYDVASLIKAAILKGVSYIPSVGSAFSFLLGLFWPEKQSNLWKEILAKTEQMIEEANLKTIKGILQGTIDELERKITHVTSLLDKNPGTSEAHDAYMFLARYLIGLEKRFKSFDDKTNFQILPLYSMTLALQSIFWRMGQEKSAEVSLSDIEFNEVYNLNKQLLGEAKDYISAVYQAEYKRVVNTATAATIVQDLMPVRGHALLHGVEILEMLEHKFTTPIESPLTARTISYSGLFGRSTAKLMTLALVSDEKMPEPLKPVWLGNQYNRITKITGHIQRIGGAPRVGGVTILYANGSTYTMGTRNTESVSYELGGTVIRSIEVWGSQAIDKIVFTFDSGKTFSFGETPSGNYRKYALPGHCISGFFIASDAPSLAGQAAGLLVSYNLWSDYNMLGNTKDIDE